MVPCRIHVGGMDIGAGAGAGDGDVSGVQASIAGTVDRNDVTGSR